jgi:hypothetical protein
MSAEIDDRQLQRYLLGQLPQGERDSVVERLTQDERYFDAAEALEAELRDAFVRGELSPRDREDFEQHLLRTPRQKEETALARHLVEALDRSPRAVPPPASRLVWGTIAAAAALAAVATWVALENRKLRQELDAARSTAQAIVAAHPRAESVSAPEIASLYLPEIVVRGSNAPPELLLSPHTQLARLEFEPELNGPLQVQLEDSTQKRIWMRALPAGSASPVRIWLPADLLPAGLYTLRIAGSAQSREAVYHFSVRWAKAQSPSTTKPAQ